MENGQQQAYVNKSLFLFIFIILSQEYMYYLQVTSYLKEKKDGAKKLNNKYYADNESEQCV